MSTTIIVTANDDSSAFKHDPANAPGPVLDFGPERGPGKGTMADLGATNTTTIALSVRLLSPNNVITTTLEIVKLQRSLKT